MFDGFILYKSGTRKRRRNQVENTPTGMCSGNHIRNQGNTGGNSRLEICSEIDSKKNKIMRNKTKSKTEIKPGKKRRSLILDAKNRNRQLPSIEEVPEE
jgi:hypothetical protein